MNEQGGRKLEMSELERKSVTEFKNQKKQPIVIVLDNIRSLHNIGSVFRTADAFAVQKIYLCGITAQPPHREIQKTALGATESVDWEYAEDCLDVLAELKKEQFALIGVEQVVGSQNLNDVSFNPDIDNVALVFGNEVRGVSQQVLNACETYIEIPQYGTKHSLNVSVSVGVVLWELLRKTR